MNLSYEGDQNYVDVWKLIFFLFKKYNWLHFILKVDPFSK